MLLLKWRKNYCSTQEELEKRVGELGLSSEDPEEPSWTTSTHAKSYYKPDAANPKVMRGTAKLTKLCDTFRDMLVRRAEKVNAEKPEYVPPPRTSTARLCKHKGEFGKRE